MRYAIYSYRQLDKMSFVGYAVTKAEAKETIDRLARERKKELESSRLKSFMSGDKVYFTYLPEGSDE